MTIEIPWGYVEAALGIAVCVTAGALLGVIVVGLRMAGERRAQDR